MVSHKFILSVVKAVFAVGFVVHLPAPVVYEVHLVIIIDHHVVELDVGVNVAGEVEVLHSLDQLDADLDDIFYAKAHLSPPFLHAALDVLENEEVGPERSIESFGNISIINGAMV